MRWVFTIGLFILLFLIETSFVSGLPLPYRLSPLVFASSIYFVQHQGYSLAVWWLVLHGLLLDILHIGATNVDTIGYVIAGFASLQLSKHIFTNRSFYGVLMNGILSFFVLVATLTMIMFIASFFGSDIQWLSHVQEYGWRFLLLIGLIIILYPFASHIRTFMTHTFLLSQSKKRT